MLQALRPLCSKCIDYLHVKELNLLATMEKNFYFPFHMYKWTHISHVSLSSWLTWWWSSFWKHHTVELGSRVNVQSPKCEKWETPLKAIKSPNAGWCPNSAWWNPWSRGQLWGKSFPHRCVKMPHYGMSMGMETEWSKSLGLYSLWGNHLLKGMVGAIIFTT